MNIKGAEVYYNSYRFESCPGNKLKTDKMIKSEVDLELSIKALEVYSIEPAIIKNMLSSLQKVVKQNHTLQNTNKRLLFAAYLQGKRDQIYWATKWEDYSPIGKYRIMKQFLRWYSTVY